MATNPLIVIVDDDELVRRSLERLLQSVGYQVQAFSTVQELSTNQAVLRDAGCLILDVRLPITSGLEFQQKLKRDGHVVPVIFVTGHGDIPMSVRAMKAGAVDFLVKPFREQDMLDAVAAAVERGHVVSEHTVSVELRARYESLTERERTIMSLATSGLLNKQIAAELCLSEITVKIQRGKISKKMEAKSFADLARMAEMLKLPR